MNTKNKIIKVRGLIIKEADYKEYDKLLTLITKEIGKINVYAFGVRKVNSKNIGKIRPFTFVIAEIREVKGMYQLDSTTLIKDFSKLSCDYDDIRYASYFIELADYFALENEVEDDVYDLLYYSFKALIDKKVEMALIKRIFELKMLKYQGLYIDTESIEYKKLTYTWDFVLKTMPQKLYSFNLSDELKKIFFDVVDKEMEKKVNKKFVSLLNMYEK